MHECRCKDCRTILHKHETDFCERCRPGLYKIDDEPSMIQYETYIELKSALFDAVQGCMATLYKESGNTVTGKFVYNSDTRECGITWQDKHTWSGTYCYIDDIWKFTFDQAAFVMVLWVQQ